jgi:Ca2+-binding RTX toxin-like protein
MIESLETRRMMSAGATALGNSLFVWGDDSANRINIAKDGGELVVKEYQSFSRAYAEIYRVSDSYVQRLYISGYGGADSLTINDDVTDSATVRGGAGADSLKGGGGLTQLWGHGEVAGTSGISPATDDGAADTLVSGSGHTTHYGQKGNDIFYTDVNLTSGQDAMYGGPDNDTFYLRGHGPDAYAMGDAGADVFYPAEQATQKAFMRGGDGPDRVSYRTWNSPVYVNLDASVLSGQLNSVRRHVLSPEMEYVDGSEHGDAFYGWYGDESFHGWGGDDKMFGGSGSDTLIGDAGMDTIYGQEGDDWLAGGSGDDSIFGGEHHDVMYGNQGHDEMHGGTGDDYINGREDNDWIFGDAGSDTLVGGIGNDAFYAKDGQFGNDLIYGGYEDGSGEIGYSDSASVDYLSYLLKDWTSGVEVVSY